MKKIILLISLFGALGAQGQIDCKANDGPFEIRFQNDGKFNFSNGIYFYGNGSVEGGIQYGRRESRLLFDFGSVNFPMSVDDPRVQFIKLFGDEVIVSIFDVSNGGALNLHCQGKDL